MGHLISPVHICIGTSYFPFFLYLLYTSAVGHLISPFLYLLYTSAVGHFISPFLCLLYTSAVGHLISPFLYLLYTSAVGHLISPFLYLLYTSAAALIHEMHQLMCPELSENCPTPIYVTPPSAQCNIDVQLLSLCALISMFASVFELKFLTNCRGTVIIIIKYT